MMAMRRSDQAGASKAWRNSPEYAEAKKVRDECARASMVVVEGM